MDEGIIDIFKRKLREEVGEGLIQPEIVPPVHRDKISEPVMHQFVCNNFSELVSLGLGGVGYQVVISVCDYCCILHRVTDYAWQKYLVKFLERIFMPEISLEKSHRLLC
jgi:hypothetical protein